MTLNALFWFFVFLKPIFWVLFPWNYSVGTLAWAAAITIPLILQAAKLGFRLRIGRGKSCWLYFFYFVICFATSLFSNIPAILYALILLVPFLHSTLFQDKADFFLSPASGILGALTTILLVMFALGVGDLSSREASSEIGPNTLGLTAALSTYLSYRAVTSTSGNRRIFWRLSAAFSLLILILTLSKTSIAALLIALAFSTKPLHRINLIKIFAAITIASILLYSYAPTLYTKVEAGEVTFTGRTLLWEGIVSHLSGWSILVGNGYNSSKEITREIGFEIFQVTSFTQAHNAYLEAYLNTGILGVAVIFGIIYIFAKTYFLRFNAAPSFITSRGVFIILGVRSLMEASITQPGSTDSLIFFSLFLLTCQQFTSNASTTRKTNSAGHDAFARSNP